jgi:dephospho-CoA kinase
MERADTLQEPDRLRTLTQSDMPPRPPLLVALTGGIASGKSAVATLFANRGVPVLDTDQIARDLVAHDSPILTQLAREFGPNVLTDSGELDRAGLRERVFNDPAEREKLEAIMHPAIRAELERRMELAGGPYQLHVIPLLVETGRARDYDRVLVVDCPEALQVSRLTKRDDIDESLANQMLNVQATREQRLASADDVIVNTGTLDDLDAFVDTLHKNYSLLAERLAAS